MSELLYPKEVQIKGRRGDDKTFIISEIPAVDGRKIAALYPVSNIPKLGEYNVSEEAMLLLMRYVAVVLDDGRELRLTTKALVDNHVPGAEALLRLEYAMLEYNFSFFGEGGLSAFLSAQIREHLPSIIRTLTDSLQQSSAPAKRDIQS